MPNEQRRKIKAEKQHRNKLLLAVATARFHCQGCVAALETDQLSHHTRCINANACFFTQINFGFSVPLLTFFIVYFACSPAAVAHIIPA